MTCTALLQIHRSNRTVHRRICCDLNLQLPRPSAVDAFDGESPVLPFISTTSDMCGSLHLQGTSSEIAKLTSPEVRTLGVEQIFLGRVRLLTEATYY